jgi:protein TonB
MSYATQQRDPRRHLTGIGFVVLFHIALVYGLVNGLARKVVDVLSNPLDVQIIEAPKPIAPPPPPPPPPPKVVAVPRPKIAPPPAYVPPPEVTVNTPPAPTIQATQAVPPPPAPVAPPEPPAPPAPPPAPAVVSVGVTCPNHVNIRSSVPYPPRAQQMNLSGDVLVEFVVRETGAIGNVRIVKSSNSVFNDVVTAAVARFQCVGQGQPVRVLVPFQFKLDN